MKRNLYKQDFGMSKSTPFRMVTTSIVEKSKPDLWERAQKMTQRLRGQQMQKLMDEAMEKAGKGKGMGRY